MSDEQREAPDPNPLPNVDTRYTGTPDDAIDAEFDGEYGDEARRISIIDLQPTNRPSRGGGGNGRARTKPKKQLRARCTACGKKQTVDVTVCQCGGHVVVVQPKKRGRKPMDSAKRKDKVISLRLTNDQWEIIFEGVGINVLKRGLEHGIEAVAKKLQEQRDDAA